MSSNQLWRRTYEYRGWKMLVIMRDGACQCCGSKDNLHAHHIKSAAFWPDLKFEVSNGVSICNDCHKFIHNQIAGGYRNMCSDRHLGILMQLQWHRRVLRKKLERVLRKEMSEA